MFKEGMSKVSAINSCYWCGMPITDKDEFEELPKRGKAHKKCAGEWYISQME